MKNLACGAPRTLLSVLTFMMVLTLTIPSWATGNFAKSDLSGTWNITLHGNTGCGLVAMLVNATLNTSGAGTASLITHGQCGDSTLAAQTFTIKTLGTNGFGTANLTCGAGCGWNFDIQVAPDRSKFSLVDVSPANPGNYLEGVAVVGSADNDISTSDLAGNWQATLYGATGCGVTTMLVTFTLDSSGVATNAASTGHSSGCPDGTVSGLTFTIESINPDGNGTATLTCGTGCGWNFNIQLSPDRSTFNIADVSTVNPGNYLAGEAIRSSSVGDVTKTNLAGTWDVAIVDATGCGFGSLMVTFTLNSSGVATNATETGHTAGCGNIVTTGNTFTIQSLNADGSGTANLTCGPSCGWNLNIQVSPDRSTFNLIDVSTANPGNYLIGEAIHR